MNVFNTIRDRSVGRWARIALRAGDVLTTYGALMAQAEELAVVLEQLGLKPGMGIGIVDRNSPEFVVCMLAGVKCEAVVLPIASNLTLPEQEQIIREVGLHAVLHGSESGPVSVGAKSYTLQLFARTQRNIAPHVPDAAFIRFSSGTTGTSKGVILGHRTVLERIAATNEGFGFIETDVVVCVLPMAYHFVASIMLYLHAGITIVLSEDFTGGQIVHAAEASGATLLYAAPMHIRLLLSDSNCTSLGPLRRVISTSAGLPSDLCHRFFGKFQVPVSQAFGIIEVGLPIMNLVHAAERPEAVGRSLPSYEVAVLDELLQPLPDGTTGQLAVRGPGIFDGYLSPPVVRSEVLRDGWFLTGDLAVQDSAGLITIRGRSKSMINVAGNKVFPEEVEAVINAHPLVRESRVRGGPHALLGEVVEAEIVLVADALLDAEDLVSFCRKQLTAHKLPQRIRFVEALEMTPTGKVKRS